MLERIWCFYSFHMWKADHFTFAMNFHENLTLFSKNVNIYANHCYDRWLQASEYFILICGLCHTFFALHQLHFYFINVRKITQLLHMHHDYHIFRNMYRTYWSSTKTSENTGKIYFQPIIFIILMVYVSFSLFFFSLCFTYLLHCSKFMHTHTWKKKKSWHTKHITNTRIFEAHFEVCRIIWNECKFLFFITVTTT